MSQISAAALGSCSSYSSPKEILECVIRQFPSPIPHSSLHEFLIAGVKELNAAKIPNGPFGLLRKAHGNNCNGFSCDIVCAGQGRDQLQWDVLVDEKEPAWSGPLTYEMGARIDDCVIPDANVPGPGPSGNRLDPNQSLVVDQSLRSPDGSTVLVLQGDGNMVIYRNGAPRWASNTSGQPSKAVMQGDGNFVLYGANGSSVWNTGTHGNDNSFLDVNNDGTIAIVNSSGAILWRSNGSTSPTPPAPPAPTPPGPTPPAPTPPGPNPQGSVLHANQEMRRDQSISSPNGMAVLVLQGDGNLVLYRDGAPRWASNTFGEPGTAVMQGDGNFVLYGANGAPAWSTGTHGNDNSRLQIRDDGSIVILSSGGVILWRAGG